MYKKSYFFFHFLQYNKYYSNFVDEDWTGINFSIDVVRKSVIWGKELALQLVLKDFISSFEIGLIVAKTKDFLFIFGSSSCLADENPSKRGPNLQKRVQMAILTV